MARVPSPNRQASIELERETGIEPATNGLGSRYSTIELLPHLSALYACAPLLLTPSISAWHLRRVYQDEALTRALRRDLHRDVATRAFAET